MLVLIADAGVRQPPDVRVGLGCVFGSRLINIKQRGKLCQGI